MAEQLTLNQLVGSSSLPRLTSIPSTNEPVRALRAGSLIRAGDTEFLPGRYNGQHDGLDGPIFLRRRMKRPDSFKIGSS